MTSATYRYGAPPKLTDEDSPDIGDPNMAWRLITDGRWKYVDIDGGTSLLFDHEEDPGEMTNLADDPAYESVLDELREAFFDGFDWAEVHRRLEDDLEREPEFRSGKRPTTPNQYVMDDGRVFDAEGDLYDARWLYVPPDSTGGIIPQDHG